MEPFLNTEYGYRSELEDPAQGNTISLDEMEVVPGRAVPLHRKDQIDDETG